MIIIFSFVILSITYKKGGTMGTDNLVFLEVVECSDGTEKELVLTIPKKSLFSPAISMVPWATISP